MAKLSEEYKRDAFFYAQNQEAQFYDDVIELSQPNYRQAHSTLIDLLRYHFDAWDPDRCAAVHGTILDAGVGTGAEGLETLATFPNVRLVGVDLSAAMLDRFRQNYQVRFGTPAEAERCILICEDLFGEWACESAFRELLPSSERSSGYRAVITAFALHHYNSAEKEHLYRQFHSVLEPGGLLLNADLFTYEAPDLARYASDDIENWNIRQFSAAAPSLSQKLEAFGQRPQEICEFFLRHIREYNTPLPVESDLIAADDSLSGQPGELQLLRKAGFRQVGCPYRCFQCGILWGRK